MVKKFISGCGTALVTPFREDGSVDYEAYDRMVERQVRAGIDFLVPLGTTAETPCLENGEKLRILEITRERACGKPVVAGCGTNSLKATLANVRMMEPLGPDAFLVVVPYYNKPTQEGMYQYFKAVAESTDKPVVVYNVPGRTGDNMEAATTLRLAEIPNIVAIKEASGNMAQIREIIAHAPEDFSVLSGDDGRTADILEAGGDGLISVASNIDPELLIELVHLYMEGHSSDGRMLSDRLVPLFRACFEESNPIPVKGGLSLMGMCENRMRLPLTPATEKTLEIMGKVLRGLGY